jgi:hypothetical protein
VRPPRHWLLRSTVCGAGRRSDGGRFDIALLSRYLLHDPVHHLDDVTGYRSA